MKTLTKKTGWRQTECQVRDGKDRHVLVALEPRCLVLRLKNTRTELRVPWSQIYVRAAQAEAESRRPHRRRPMVRRGALA